MAFRTKRTFRPGKSTKGGAFVNRAPGGPAGRKAARPLKFAFGNRIHWLSWEASANWRSLPGRFRAVRPPKFALENRIHWLSREASANRRSLPGRFRAVRPPKFALENRIHWLSREASANREAPEAGFGRSRPACQPGLQKQKTLNRRTEASADSKFFRYILHPIYKEETYSFSPKAKRRMVRPTPSSSLLSAT